MTETIATTEGTKSMAERYEEMQEREQAEQDAQLPPGAREREEAAQAAANKIVEGVRYLLGEGMLQPVGYRMLIKPIENIMGLEQAEAEAMPTLAEAGFQVKSEAQKQREQRGEDHGIVIAMGDACFLGKGGPEAWGINVGDLVVFRKYAGVDVEHPRGSGKTYQIVNDEDVFGKLQ